MDLTFKEREFSGSFTRGICESVYGQTISRNAWQNWRRWASVPTWRRSYTFEQVCFLYAIALIRSRDEDRYRELRRSEIRAIAEDVETQELIADFVAFIDSSLVIGRDAPKALRARGIKVSLRTLYRNVPGFCVNHVYQIDELKEWAVA